MTESHPSSAAATALDTIFVEADQNRSAADVSLADSDVTKDLGMGRASGEKGWCDVCVSRVTLGDILAWLNNRVDGFFF